MRYPARDHRTRPSASRQYIIDFNMQEYLINTFFLQYLPTLCYESTLVSLWVPNGLISIHITLCAFWQYREYTVVRAWPAGGQIEGRA
jgi:hypothetical protein